MRTTVHTTLKATPGSLVYQRDMILNILVVADLLDITARRQHLIDEQTMAENRKQISHDYQPNDQVLVLVYKSDKLEPRACSPYSILHTHMNGTVTIRRSPTVMEQINICRLRPSNRHGTNQHTPSSTLPAVRFASAQQGFPSYT